MTLLTYIFASTLSITGLVIAIKYLKPKKPSDLLYKASDYNNKPQKLKIEIKRHSI